MFESGPGTVPIFQDVRVNKDVHSTRDVLKYARPTDDVDWLGLGNFPRRGMSRKFL